MLMLWKPRHRTSGGPTPSAHVAADEERELRSGSDEESLAQRSNSKQSDNQAEAIVNHLCIETLLDELAESSGLEEIC